MYQGSMPITHFSLKKCSGNVKIQTLFVSIPQALVFPLNMKLLNFARNVFCAILITKFFTYCDNLLFVIFMLLMQYKSGQPTLSYILFHLSLF